MTFAADDGSPKVEIAIRRTAAGIRTATSATDHADLEDFLRSLREHFVLVDYRKFARFIDDTALVRGRSFAALVGLSRYSSLRPALEGARHTQSLNTDFDMRAVETEIKGGERQLSDYARLALAAYTDVTSETAADLADILALRASVTAALRAIELLKEILGAADIMAADFDALEKAVEAAEGGLLRRQHATFSARVGTLRDLTSSPDEAAERASLLAAVTARDDALLQAGSSLLRQLYESASAVVGDESWADPFLCPVCDTNIPHRLDAHIAAKLAAYSHADELNTQLGTAVAVAGSLARLGKLEGSAHLAVAAVERRHATVTAAARTNTLPTGVLQEAFALLDALETKHTQLLAEAEAAAAAVEKQLPPSLVAVTRVVGAAKRFRDAINSVRIERITDAVPGIAYPRLVEASGRCPPEDVGGPWGYRDFLEAIADPDHEQQVESVTWVGDDFDPTALDVERLANDLAALRQALVAHAHDKSKATYVTRGPHRMDTPSPRLTPTLAVGMPRGPPGNFALSPNAKTGPSATSSRRASGRLRHLD